MGVSVGAVIKKIAAVMAADPEKRKKLSRIILIALIVILFPVFGLSGLSNAKPEIEYKGIEEKVLKAISEEEIREIKKSEEMMGKIEKYMENAGHDKVKIRQAQLLYMLVLSSHNEDGFPAAISSCFIEEQTEDELARKINAKFGTDIKGEELKNVFRSLKNPDIDSGCFQIPESKNNLDLVRWAVNARNEGWGYVYGTYGNILTAGLLDIKASQYPDYVGSNRRFIEQNWLGGRVADCVGLIKGYSWYDPETKEIKPGSNSMPDIGANRMYENAVEKGPISSIPEIPGLAVWQKGHIGIYIGDGRVIHAANTYKGVIESDIRFCSFTHWLKIPYINYTESENED